MKRLFEKEHAEIRLIVYVAAICLMAVLVAASLFGVLPDDDSKKNNTPMITKVGFVKINTKFFNPLIQQKLDFMITSQGPTGDLKVSITQCQREVFFNNETKKFNEVRTVNPGGSKYSGVAYKSGNNYRVDWNGKIENKLSPEGLYALNLVVDGQDADSIFFIVDYKLDLETIGLLNGLEHSNLSINDLNALEDIVRDILAKETNEPLYVSWLKMAKLLDQAQKEGGKGVLNGHGFTLNEYNFFINYKELVKDDVNILKKGKLNILSGNQGPMARKIKELSNRESVNFGYLDGAGVSSFDPYVEVKKDKSGRIKKIWIKDEKGEKIKGSGEWFIKDNKGNYCAYWNGTGFMTHISNPDYRDWYFKNRIEPLTGDFDGVFLDDIWSGVYTGPASKKTPTGPGSRYQKDVSKWLEKGEAYSASMTDFLKRISLFLKGKNKKLIINTWLEDKSVMPGYAASADFVLNESSTHTWNMSNFITKQFKVNDFFTAKEGLEELSAGHDSKLLTVAYPYSDHSHLALIAANLLLTELNDSEKFPTIAVSGSNINLSQVFLSPFLEADLGKPVGGMSEVDKSGYEPVLYRLFENGILFYNPSRVLKIFNYKFNEEHISYPLRDKVKRGENKIKILPRSMIYFAEKGSRFYRQTNKEWFSHENSNACFVVFTKEGRDKIINAIEEAGQEEARVRTNSVWIENGYSNNKYFIFDGEGKAPLGKPTRLFHAANEKIISKNKDGGLNLSEIISVGNPQKETIILTSKGTFLSSQTVYHVADVIHTGRARLKIGVDYTVNYNETFGNGKYTNKNNEPGRRTKITLLNNSLAGEEAVVYYFDKNGPDSSETGHDYLSKEFGLLYRLNDKFKLKTGGVDENECTVYLEQGADFNVIPEPAIWEWLYKKQVTISDDKIKINTKDLHRHWGSIHPETLVVIDEPQKGKDEHSGGMIRFKKEDIKISKPRILVYGFQEKVRDKENHGETIPPGQREIEAHKIESILKKDEGVLFERVLVTGDYDEFGSINGFIGSSANDIGNINDISEYFDVLLIADSFQEFAGRPLPVAREDSVPMRHDNGRWDFQSWLLETDKKLLTSFYGKSKKHNKMIIDRRGAVLSFDYFYEPPYFESKNGSAGEAVVSYKFVGDKLSGELSKIFSLSGIEGYDLNKLTNSHGNGPGIKSGHKILTNRLEKITGNYFSPGDVTSKSENGGEYITHIPANSIQNFDSEGFSRIFAIEANTGGITGLGNFHNGKDGIPHILWLGASYDDIFFLIKKWIGTKIMYKNLANYTNREKVSVYYNVLTDKLDYLYSYGEERVLTNGALEKGPVYKKPEKKPWWVFW